MLNGRMQSFNNGIFSQYVVHKQDTELKLFWLDITKKEIHCKWTEHTKWINHESTTQQNNYFLSGAAAT